MITILLFLLLCGICAVVASAAVVCDELLVKIRIKRFVQID